MLGDDSIVLLIVLICMVVMSAYFSATETAFTSLNRIRLKSRADNGDARAARVLALADKYDQLLSTILIGNNIVNNVATTLSAVLFIDLLGKTSGPAVSTVVLTIVDKDLSPQDMDRCRQIARDLGVTLRIREYIPN